MKTNTAENQIAEHNDAWKGRGNLGNLVKELERQRASRIDFVADTRTFKFEVVKGDKPEANRVLLAPTTDQSREWLPDGPMTINGPALVQVGDKSEPNIPKKFLDRMLFERPERLGELLNGLREDAPSNMLVRCLDGNVRGWLSDRYRVIDNHDIAFACLDAAQRSNGQVIEAALSDTKMRIKFTSQSVWDTINIKQTTEDRGKWFAGAIGNKELIGRSILGAKITGELPGGPGTVHPVITISNSETGHGGFRVRLGILMGICYNVATLEDVVSQIHLGERLDTGIFTAETIAKDSAAIMSKARDAVAAAFDQTKFKRIIAKAKAAQERPIEQPTAAVENVIEVHEINAEKKEALLEYFLRDYDQTQFGLAQAVSRLAQDTNDTDEATDLEDIAGKLIAA